MRIFKDVWTDLVDKRLWPVAAALVVALVAIPVLLLEPAGSTGSPEPPSPVADAGPAALVTDPAAIAAARPGGPVGGKFKNPFAQQHVPKAQTGESTGSAAGPGTAESGPGSSGGSQSAGGGPGKGRGGGRGGGKPQRTASEPSGETGKRLKVRFGRTEGKMRTRTLAPGAPLTSTADPVVVFVEVGRGNRAEFLVSSDAVPQGDGRCKPSRTVCAQLFVKPGDTQFFDVTRDRGVVQYQLDVLEVIG